MFWFWIEQKKKKWLSRFLVLATRREGPVKVSYSPINIQILMPNIPEIVRIG